MNNKAKMIIGCIMVVIGIIAIICCAIAGIIITILNPDMTEMRQFIEYPEPTIIALISLVAVHIGTKMID